MRNFKVYVKPHSEDGKTPTSFEFNQPKGCNKVYNCYKTMDDDFELENLTSVTIYGYSSKEESEDESEEFKSTLPKYLHKYIHVTTTCNRLREDGYVDYDSAEPAITISVYTGHKYSENKHKKVVRLMKEVKEFDSRNNNW
jgi:hypothetical protein